MDSKEKRENSIIKSAGVVGVYTTLSRIFGYFRDAALALVLGAGFGMDAFTVAFRLANLCRRFVAEGAMNTAFVPVFIQYRLEQSHVELWNFVRKFFYTFAVIVFVLVALEIVFAPWIVRFMAPGFSGVEGKWALTTSLMRLMAPYLFFVALAAVVMGVLNSLGHFAVPALSPVFFNLSVIGSALFFAKRFDEPAFGVACGVLVGGSLQFLVQVPVAVKRGMKFGLGFSLHHPAIRKISRLLTPSLLGAGLIQLNLFVDSLMASFLREGSVSHIYYADRVMELVLGIFVLSVATVILPDMARSAADKRMDDVKHTLFFSVRSVAFIAIPATVGLVMLAEPIIHVLFERGRFTAADTSHTAFALTFYALGLFFMSAGRLVMSAFYSLQDTRTPAKTALLALIANVILNAILMHPMKQGGIALATSIASVLSFTYLVVSFRKRHGPVDWAPMAKSLGRTLASCAVMGVAIVFMLQWAQIEAGQPLGWKVMTLFGTIGLSVVIYFLTAVVFRSEEVKTFKKMIPFRKHYSC